MQWSWLAGGLASHDIKALRINEAVELTSRDKVHTASIHDDVVKRCKLFTICHSPSEQFQSFHTAAATAPLRCSCPVVGFLLQINFFSPDAQEPRANSLITQILRKGDGESLGRKRRPALTACVLLNKINVFIWNLKGERKKKPQHGN